MHKLLVLGLIGGLFIGTTATAVFMKTSTPRTAAPLEVGMGQGQGRGHMYGIGVVGGKRGGAMRSSITQKNCLGDECLSVEDLEYPVATLSDAARTALDRALTDEYHAHTTCAAVIAKFGSVRPFAMIIRAEEQHINALKAVYNRYGITPPAQEKEVIAVASTLAEMCSVGVAAENANVALYRDELLPTVNAYEDITFVFTNLMNASQEKHLPAFERCSS